jgi:glycosyltransferase involved in cell wall biosynthesis
MAFPGVSVIVPCYNEEHTIQLLLEAIYHQSYPRQAMEVIIADGMSSDNTRQRIEQFRLINPDLSIRILDNPKRIIPAALNEAIRAANMEYILRLDAHSQPYPDFIEKSILALQSGKGSNVGGIWEIQPFHLLGKKASTIARGIAAAAAHPLGVGDAFYRFGSTPRQVDTVPFGAFRKDLAEKVGLFDESLLTNEDYEFNVRIRQNGGTIWLDPAIRCKYFARPTLSTLWKQYWRYGFWKARMVTRYPETIRWRQALPPLFVLSLLILLGLSIGVWWAFWLLTIQTGSYLLITEIIATITAMRKRDAGLLFSMPLAIVIMHFAWGLAFLWSLIIVMLRNQNNRATSM